MVEQGEVVRSFYERVGSGDLPGGLALVDEACRWIEMETFGHAGVYVGPEAVRDNIFVRIGSEWDDFSLSVDDVLDGGDAVFGTGTYAGTCKATGRRFEARVVHRFHVRDEKIVQFEQFTDTAAIAAARES